MICRFCDFDFSTAAALDVLVVRCSEHNCEVCPQCYSCQKAGPSLLTAGGMRRKYAEET